MNAPLLHRILVPLDGSSNAEAVLSHLRRILPRHESELILIQVLPFPLTSSEREAEAYLRRVSFQLTNDGYPAWGCVRIGRPEDVILETAVHERVSLIAMTTHGRTGAARWILGSVSERVLQASPLPVLVTPAMPKTLSRGSVEALPIRRFLLPLDGSRLSLGSLGPVLQLARPVDAQVSLLYVSEPSPYDGRWDPLDDTFAEADRVLKEACIPVSLEFRKGEPSEEILRVAEEKQVDLVAMTTHGRSGPSRWMFGSVAAKVLRSGSVPLLCVRRASAQGAPSAGAAGISASSTKR